MLPIIKVENLSKQYRIGARQEPYGTLRDSLAKAVKAPLNRLRRNGHSDDNRIWAIKDLSFEVEPGEAIGIIGHNGAGKSTLLKILSRITEPTTGSVDIYGRVGSLLEVGTGFHPELTGRENIYLNGVILGMKKAEIKRRFDEIVAFSGIEDFDNIEWLFHSIRETYPEWIIEIASQLNFQDFMEIISRNENCFEASVIFSSLQPVVQIPPYHESAGI